MDANLLLFGCGHGGSDAAMNNRRINASEGLVQTASQDSPYRGDDSPEAIACHKPLHWMKRLGCGNALLLDLEADGLAPVPLGEP